MDQGDEISADRYEVDASIFIQHNGILIKREYDCLERASKFPPDMASVWFISAPANPTKQETITKLSDRISSSKNDNIADLFPVTLPEFKVGTLDSLMVISDELVKQDQVVESCVLKMVDIIRTLVPEDVFKSLLIVNESCIV